jgi:inhibitor of cysteine peptidase
MGQKVVCTASLKSNFFGGHMKSKSLSLLSLALMIACATACNSAKLVSLTAADNGSSVEVAVGGRIVISLNGNPSTGFTWEVTGLDATLFEQVGDPLFSSSNPGLVGSGGTMTFDFKTLLPGTGKLTLIYHRPWETGTDPIDIFVVNVTIK